MPQRNLPDSEQYQRMISGQAYELDYQLRALEKVCSETLAKINVLPFSDEQRTLLLRGLLGSLGQDVVIKENFHCDYGCHLFIGDRTYINYNFVALDVCPITIGQDVFIGPQVTLTCATHPLDYKPRTKGINLGGPITIKDGAWLGAGVIVLPGVTIGARAVVGAGAVVTKDVPDDALVTGVPARIVRNIIQS